MKKWLSLLLAVVMLFSFTACTQEEVDTTLEILDAVVSALPDETEDPIAPPAETLPDSQAPPAEEAAPSTPPVEQEQPAAEEQPPVEEAPFLPEDGQYDDKDNVALYIHLYGKLPSNFLSKSKARSQYGWEYGPLDKLAPGMAIGGSQFGNNEGLLPDAKGRTWTECDIGTVGTDSRGSKRIVFSNDGLIYYTEDHYETFELLYGEE